MANGHEQNEHHWAPRAMPASLLAPEVVSKWRKRAIAMAVVTAAASLTAFGGTHEGRNHLLRAYLMGYMLCFGFAGGGLALLMLQYVTGGKWGLLIRRPLEAMSRTLPLVAALFIPIAIFWKHLYKWAEFPTQADVAAGLAAHKLSLEDALALNAKRPMLSPEHVGIITVVVFAVLLLFMYLLNRWSLERDNDPEANTQASYEKWRRRFENLSGPGILIYVLLLTAGAISWVMSLDVSWSSSVWGFQFLVGQGYAVLALSILTVIKLSDHQPMKTFLRKTEQHDLGKLAFAFVMLNIYLAFAAFLIIWSGNLPDEIPWYLSRIHGGWWTVCTADVVFHWALPFCLLLSRDIKRNKAKMVWLAGFMLLARAVDMFWLIEPNFSDAAGNLHILHNHGILAYISVPLSVVALWAAYYLTQLKARPLMPTNDPHVEEILEPEHAH